MDGLVLYSPIRTDTISADKRVLKFIQSEQTEESLLAMLQAEQILYTNRMLLQSFDWQKMIAGLQDLIRSYVKRKIVDREDALNWARDLLAKVRALADTATKFAKQLKGLLVTDAANNYSHLQQRVCSAQEYFDGQFLQLESLVHLHREKYTGKAKGKKYRTDLNALINLFERKRKELKNAVEMAADIQRIKEKDQASASSPELRNIDPGPSAPLQEALLHQ
jgi:hypothetical protein